MNLLVFDTETTGLAPGQICQLAYIIVNDDLIEGKNFYFTVSRMEPGAQRVHGLSVEQLERLSGGRRFSDHYAEISRDFGQADRVVAHNFSFDNAFMAGLESTAEQATMTKPWVTTGPSAASA